MKFNKDKFDELLSPSKVDFFNEVEKMIDNQSDRLANAQIAMRLFDYIEEKAISRKQLAQTLGISTQYLSRILNGRINITIGKALYYGEKLGLNLIVIPKGNSSKVNMTAVRKFTPKNVWGGNMTFDSKRTDRYPLN